ncbi:MAG TPA: lysophospholipid acyltransferase family protein [Albitalea sp.]|uniref:lysophospholipid acyltransferase family protein n=1 Tax=Piscinibacter sp. TaxID=1903157 RepID=UPI002ED2E34A
MTVLRGAWRVARAIVHMLHGALICLAVFPFLDTARRLQRVGWWNAKLLRLLGISLHTSGTPHAGATLVVSNHVSWLDILVINAVHPLRFVSKADVRHWPLIGWLVAAAGTLFIERERKRDALRVVHQVAEALKAGDTIAVFPEGTTSDGRGVLPFHANLLQAAIVTGTPIQPIALRFADAAHAVSPAAAYIGDTTLLQSLWAIVTATRMSASVTWLAPEASAQAERRALGETLHGRIADALGVTEYRSAA